MEYEVMEIIMYRTTDGKTFEDEEKAQAHQDELILAQVDPSTIIAKNRWGESLSPADILDQLDSIFFLEITTDEALDFFQTISNNRGVVAPSSVGFWRWAEEYDEWISPEEDLEKLQENWSFYTDKVEFNFTDS